MIYIASRKIGLSHEKEKNKNLNAKIYLVKRKKMARSEEEFPKDEIKSHPEADEKGLALNSNVPSSPDELKNLQKEIPRKVNQINTLRMLIRTGPNDDKYIALSIIAKLVRYHIKSMEFLKRENGFSEIDLITWKNDLELLKNAYIKIDSIESDEEDCMYF